MVMPSRPMACAEPLASSAVYVTAGVPWIGSASFFRIARPTWTFETWMPRSPVATPPVIVAPTPAKS